MHSVLLCVGNMATLFLSDNTYQSLLSSSLYLTPGSATLATISICLCLVSGCFELNVLQLIFGFHSPYLNVMMDMSLGSPAQLTNTLFMARLRGLSLASRREVTNESFLVKQYLCT